MNIYNEWGTILLVLYTLAHLILEQPYEVDTIIIPIFKMRKLRH